MTRKCYECKLLTSTAESDGSRCRRSSCQFKRVRLNKLQATSAIWLRLLIGRGNSTYGGILLICLDVLWQCLHAIWTPPAARGGLIGPITFDSSQFRNTDSSIPGVLEGRKHAMTLRCTQQVSLATPWPWPGTTLGQWPELHRGFRTS